jgi:AraC-like DNA-binding protein
MVVDNRAGCRINPLSQFPIFSSSDIEEAHDLIAQNFSRHSLNIETSQKNWTTQYDGLFLKNTALLCSTYGADVRVNPESDQYFFTQTTLEGNTEVALGNEVSHTQKGSTVVVSPTADYQMRFQKGSSRLIVMFEREALEHQLAQLISRCIKEPLLFDLTMAGDSAQSIAWSKSLFYMCEQFSLSKQMLESDAFVKHASNMLMSQLLELQSHNYTHLLHHDPVIRSPQHVRRAIAYIEEHIEEPIFLAELASAVGVSARTLQKGFLRYLDSTPSEYIRSLRMHVVHGALIKAEPTKQVSEILLQYGITSFGHFSSAYKKVHGCSPSETLKRG